MKHSTHAADIISDILSSLRSIRDNPVNSNSEGGFVDGALEDAKSAAESCLRRDDAEPGRLVAIAAFAEGVIALLEEEKEWGADTVDAIYQSAVRLKLMRNGKGGMAEVIGGVR